MPLISPYTFWENIPKHEVSNSLIVNTNNDGCYIYTGSIQGSICIWKVIYNNNIPKSIIPSIFLISGKNNSKITSLCKTFISGLNCILIGSNNGILSAWTLSGSLCLFSQQIIFPNPTKLYSSGVGNEIEISQILTFNSNSYIVISSKYSNDVLIFNNLRQVVMILSHPSNVIVESFMIAKQNNLYIIFTITSDGIVSSFSFNPNLDINKLVPTYSTVVFSHASILSSLSLNNIIIPNCSNIISIKISPSGRYLLMVTNICIFQITLDSLKVQHYIISDTNWVGALYLGLDSHIIAWTLNNMEVYMSSGIKFQKIYKIIRKSTDPISSVFSNGQAVGIVSNGNETTIEYYFINIVLNAVITHESNLNSIYFYNLSSGFAKPMYTGKSATDIMLKSLGHNPEDETLLQSHWIFGNHPMILQIYSNKLLFYSLYKSPSNLLLSSMDFSCSLILPCQIESNATFLKSISSCLRLNSDNFNNLLFTNAILELIKNGTGENTESLQNNGFLIILGTHYGKIIVLRCCDNHVFIIAQFQVFHSKISSFHYQNSNIYIVSRNDIATLSLNTLEINEIYFRSHDSEIVHICKENDASDRLIVKTKLGNSFIWHKSNGQLEQISKYICKCHEGPTSNYIVCTLNILQNWLNLESTDLFAKSEVKSLFGSLVQIATLDSNPSKLISFVNSSVIANNCKLISHLSLNCCWKYAEASFKISYFPFNRFLNTCQPFIGDSIVRSSKSVPILRSASVVKKFNFSESINPTFQASRSNLSYETSIYCKPLGSQILILDLFKLTKYVKSFQFTEKHPFSFILSLIFHYTHANQVNNLFTDPALATTFSSFLNDLNDLDIATIKIQPCPGLCHVLPNYNCYSFLTPAASSLLGRYEYSDLFSGFGLLTVTMMAMAVLANTNSGISGGLSKALTHYSVNIPNIPNFSNPSIEMFAAYALDSDEDLYLASYPLLESAIRSLTSMEKVRIVDDWSVTYLGVSKFDNYGAKISCHPTPGLIEEQNGVNLDYIDILPHSDFVSTTKSELLASIAPFDNNKDANFLSQSQLERITQILLSCFTSSYIDCVKSGFTHILIACNLLIQGAKFLSPFMHDRHSLFCCLQRLATSETNAVLAHSAGRALIEIGRFNVASYVDSMVDIALTQGDFPLTSRVGAIMSINILVKKYPASIYPNLPLIIDCFVRRILHPSQILRKVLASATTQALFILVQRFPNLSFHQESQYLALGLDKDHKCLSTIARVLEGHIYPVVACQFNETCDMIASYSAEGGGILRIWKLVDSSFLSHVLGYGGPAVQTVQLESITFTNPDNFFCNIRIAWNKSKLTLTREDKSIIEIDVTI